MVASCVVVLLSQNHFETVSFAVLPKKMFL